MQMKIFTSFAFVFFTIISSLFNFNEHNQAISFIECDSIPSINKQVVVFVKNNIGKKVGIGECWDLANVALNFISAKWDGEYNFGKEVKYMNECVFPGDIVQFENVELNYKIGDNQFIEKLLHHTAIIYKVKSKGQYVIADQNTGRSGKKVGLSTFSIKDITKGKIKIFRPIK